MSIFCISLFCLLAVGIMHLPISNRSEGSISASQTRMLLTGSVKIVNWVEEGHNFMLLLKTREQICMVARISFRLYV